MKDKFEIIKTPEIKSNEKKSFNTDDTKILEIINNFTRILESTIKKEDLKLFYNNIGTLEVDSKAAVLEIFLSFFKDRINTGLYFLESNRISVLPPKNSSILSKIIGISYEEYVANVYHELLHMSATLLTKKDNIILSGFCQSGYIDIGVALDDGYVELLLHRYFGIKKYYVSYVYESIISSLVEKVVTKEKMTSLYFNADLYNLICELEKYGDINKIENFVKDFDEIYYLQDHSKFYREDIIYFHNAISSFLTSIYLNKLNADLNKGIITKSGYDKRLDDYLNDIHRAFISLEIKDKTLKRKMKLY